MTSSKTFTSIAFCLSWTHCFVSNVSLRNIKKFVFVLKNATLAEKGLQIPCSNEALMGGKQTIEVEKTDYWSK